MVVQNAIDLSESGLVANTDGTFSGRTILPTSDQTTVLNGDGSGDPTIGLVADLQIGGISFDNGSNTLNSYIDSTSFTPEITGSTTGPDAITYSFQTGNYMRQGDVVSFNLRVDIATLTLGSAAGNLRVSGLPIASAATSYAVALREGSLPIPSDLINTCPRVNSGSTVIDIEYYRDNTSTSFISVTDIRVGSGLFISGWYFV